MFSFLPSQLLRDTKRLYVWGFFLFFFRFAVKKKKLQLQRWIFYALLVCSGENYPLAMIEGSEVTQRWKKKRKEKKRKKSWRRRKQGRVRSFLHVCITNIGQKNLSTNRGLQSSRKHRSVQEGRVTEETQRLRGIKVGGVLCHNVAFWTDFLLSTMH